MAIGSPRPTLSGGHGPLNEPHAEELVGGGVTDRREYFIRSVSPEAIHQVVRLLLEWLGPLAAKVCVDAYSDDTAVMPSNVAVAEQTLRDSGADGTRRDPGMGVEIDTSDDQGWSTLVTYAPWSIHIEVWGVDERRPLAVLHDGATSITVRLEAAQVDGLAEVLAAVEAATLVAAT
jgi:hypothetical protein